MSPEETSLARSLVALPGWRWAPGMKLAEKRIFIVWAGPDHLSCANDMFVGDLRCREGAWEARTSPHREWGPATLTEALPDLEHAGTAGILLGMLPPWHQSTRHEGMYEVTVYDCPPLAGSVVHSGPHGTAKWWTVSGDSLGVAAARALVAIGRAS